jgi:hypothetical protein
MNSFQKKDLRKRIIAGSTSLFLFFLLIYVSVIFVSREFIYILFLTVTYWAAWGIRSIHRETMDTFLGSMGPVELSITQAQIEQRLKVIGKEKE